MKKFSVLLASLLLVVGMASSVMAAALDPGTILHIATGMTDSIVTETTFADPFNFTNNIAFQDFTNDGGIDAAGDFQNPGYWGGSMFGMAGSSGFGWTGLAEQDGLIIGTAQAAGTANHSGPPAAGDTGSVVLPWFFGDNTGHNYVDGTNISLDPNTTNGSMEGWYVAWNSGFINMGVGTIQSFAVIGGDAGNNYDGGAYTLEYLATVPADVPGFGGFPYALHLEGTIEAAAIPEPASMLLIGSGLVGLFGISRKRK